MARKPEREEVRHLDGRHHLLRSRLPEHHVLDDLALRDTAFLGRVLDLVDHQRREDVPDADGEPTERSLALGDGPRETLEAVLCRDVGGLVLRGVVAVYRGHVADGADPVTGRPDVRHREFRGQERGPQHDLKQEVVLLHWELEDGGDVLHPGDVGDVPEVAGLGRRLDHRLDVGVVGQVSRHRVDGAGGVDVLGERDGLLQPLLVDVGSDDGEPVRGQRNGGRLSDAGGAPGHDGARLWPEVLIVDDEEVVAGQFRLIQFEIVGGHVPEQSRTERIDLQWVCN